MRHATVNVSTSYCPHVLNAAHDDSWAVPPAASMSRAPKEDTAETDTPPAEPIITDDPSIGAIMPASGFDSGPISRSKCTLVFRRKPLLMRSPFGMEKYSFLTVPSKSLFTSIAELT